MVGQDAGDTGGRPLLHVPPRHMEGARLALQPPAAGRRELALQVLLARLVLRAKGDAVPRPPGGSRLRFQVSGFRDAE